MAEMEVKDSGGHKKGPGVKKGKKQSTRVDLTPMVDLGFLLITFFMFATTLKTPKAAKIKMPKDDVEKDKQQEVNKETLMNAIIAKEWVYYYEGDDLVGIQHFSYDQIRQKLIDKKARMKAANIADTLAVLTIKPLPGSTYENFMLMFDERKINAIKTYVIGKVVPNEREAIDMYNTAKSLKINIPEPLSVTNKAASPAAAAPVTK
jgi:biopolymer transport protein ExbD